MSQLLQLLLAFLSASLAVAQWSNDYDGYLYYECEEGETISRLMSIHDDHHEVRLSCPVICSL